MIYKLFVLLTLALLVCSSSALRSQTVSDRPPTRVVSGQIPLYPGLVLTLGITGTVVVEAAIENGRVVDARVLRGQDIFGLPDVATENLRTWVFSPEVELGVVVVTYIYEIDDVMGRYPSNPVVDLDMRAWTVRVRGKAAFSCPLHTSEEDCDRLYADYFDSIGQDAAGAPNGQ